jgi:Leucine-rich repeat (LRR) protein
MLPFPPSLRSLTLSNNHMVSGELPSCLPDVVPRLTYLDISHMSLTHIPSSFTAFRSLTQLQASANSFTDLPDGMLPSVFIDLFGPFSQSLCTL